MPSPNHGRQFVSPYTHLLVGSLTVLIGAINASAADRVNLLVTRAAYHAVPQETRLHITADLELRQSAAGTPFLPLELGAMSLESATLDGQPAALFQRSDGRVVLIESKRETSKLQLKLSAPLHRVGRDHRAILQPVANAPATLTVEIPANRSLQLDGRAVQRVKPPNEKSQHTLAIGNRGRIELRFTTSQGSPKNPGMSNALDSVVLAESRATVALSAGIADWNCETQFHVTGTPRKSFASSVSGRMQITDVTGADVGDWRVQPSPDDPSRSIVHVTFRRPFTGTRTVILTGRAALPTEPFWQVPNVVIAGVDSHAGRVAISFPRDRGIRVDEFAGLRQSAGIPDGTRSNIVPVSARTSKSASDRGRRLLQFDFWKQDYELNLVLPKRRHNGVADAVTVFDVRQKQVDMKFAATWTAGETQRTVSLSLPAEWSIRSVVINGQPAEWQTLPVEANVQHLRIAVPENDPGIRNDPAKRTSLTRAVRLVVFAKNDLEYPDKPHASAVWKVPVVRLSESRLMRGDVVLRGGDNVSLAVSDAKDLAAIPGHAVNDRYAYRYMLRPNAGTGYSATVAVRPKSPAFSVDSLSVANLAKSALLTDHEIRITPEPGGFQELELLLPRSAALRNSLRWTDSNARLIHSERVAIEAGRARWRLQFDRTVRQPGRLQLDLTTPRRESNGTPVVMNCVRFPAAERTTGYVVFLAGRQQHLKVAADYAVAAAKRRAKRPLPLAAVAVDEVLRRFSEPNGGIAERLRSDKERVVAAYRYVVPTIAVTLTESVLSGDVAEPLTCRSQSLRTIVDASGALQHHAEFDLRGTGATELRVSFPADAELWAAMCNLRPVEVRRDGDSLVLPLVPGFLSTGNYRVELIYHQKSEPFGRGGKRRLSPPTISVKVDGLPLAIHRSEWTLYHPPELHVTEAMGEFRAVGPLNDAGWLKQLGTWAAGRSLLLLCLLLAGPFLWIVVKFARSVAAGQFGVPPWFRVAGLAAVAGILVACAFLSRSQWIGNDGEESSRISSAIPPAAHFSRPAQDADDRRTTMRMPVQVSIVAADANAYPPVGRSARLSVPVQFDPSKRFEVKRFEYLGNADAETALEFSYESQSGGFALRMCVIVVMLIGSWFLRHRSPRFQATRAVIGLTLPPVVAGWVGAEMQPLVDGVFFGTLAGLALWGLAAVIATKSSGRRISIEGRIRGVAQAAARIVLFSSVVLAGRIALADESTEVSPTGTVSAANYDITIDAKTAAVTARFDVVSFQAEPATVAIPLGRVAIVSATLDGAPAVVTWRKSNANVVPEVVLPKAGPHILQLTFLLPLTTDGDATRFLLPARPVASGRAVVRFPANDLRVRFRGLTGTYHRSVQNGTPVVAFPVDKSRDVTVSWSKAATPSATTATVVVDTAATDVEIKDSGLFQQDALSLRVANGGIAHWTFSIPDDYRIIGISGTDVAGWELSAAKGERSVRIDFRQQIQTATTVVFSLFRAERFAAESAAMTLRTVKAVAAATRGGNVSVFAGPEFVVRAGTVSGAKRIAPSPGKRTRSPRLAWRTESSASIGLQISRRTPQTAVNAEHAVLIESNRVRIASRVEFDFLGSPRSKVSLLLPEGYTLLSLRGTHDAEWSHGADETTAIVVFPKPQSGKVRVILDGTLRRKPASSKLELMLPGPMAAQRMNVTAGFWHVPGLKIDVKPVEGWQPLVGGAIPAAIRTRHSQRPVTVLRTRSPEPSLVVCDVMASASRMTAESLTLVRVTDTAIQYTFLMKWSGVTGTRKTVAFAAPGWIGRKLDLRLNRHLRIEPLLAAGGGDVRRQWIVTDFDTASREIVIVATATMPPLLALGGRVTAPKLEMLRPAKADNAADAQSAEFAAVVRPRHAVVLMNDSGDRLERSRVPKFPSFAIDESSFRIPEALRRRITRATDRLRTDAAVAQPVWNLKPALPGERGTAVVNRAELTTVLERDGSWRLRAVYRIKNGDRPNLAVTLPAESRLVTAAVAGRVARIGRLQKNGATMYLVPLPRNPNRRDEVSVQLLLAGKLPEQSFRQGGLRSLLDGSVRLSLPAPSVVSRTQDSDLGIPVQETVWTVHLAEGLMASSVSNRKETNLTRKDVGSWPHGTSKLRRTAETESANATPISVANEARELFQRNHGDPGAKSPSRRLNQNRFQFPLDDEAERSTAVDRDSQVIHVAFGGDARTATPWAASVGETVPREKRTPQEHFQSMSQPPGFEFPLPGKGQTLNFRKAGGEPQLTLQIRKREATQTRRRILWSLVWAAFGVVALVIVRKVTLRQDPAGPARSQASLRRSR